MSTVSGQGEAPMSDDGVERLFTVLLDVWPEHERHLERTLDAMTPTERQHADRAATLVMRIAGCEIRRVCEDYRWLCQRMREEQLHFARHGTYRLSTFREALDQVYDNASFMERYLNGLLVGRITWIEQLQMLTFYTDRFLPGNIEGYRHLEIGPGHGLLLYLASRDARCTTFAALDISESSLAATARCLARLGTRDQPELMIDNILSDTPREARQWDSIVVSEVLEHLEEPDRVLKALTAWLCPGGRIFVTTPVNSPMPDHIHLFNNPEEVLELVSGAGLDILDYHFFTGVGVNEARARDRRMPIACALIAQRKFTETTAGSDGRIDG